MGLKKQIRFLHKWLGLTSGLIVFIVAVTGCIFCFHDEIKDISRKEWRLVEPRVKPFVPPSVLKEKALQIHPNTTSGMVVYHGKNRSAVVYANDTNRNYYVYFNPYSGKYLQTENPDDDFFIIVEHLHMYLLLPDYIGKHIVGISTLVFIFMMVSGIVQWWPKKRKDLKNRLAVKWSAKWRRVNYDWHNISGFYIAVAATIIAITGLTFSYEWVGDGLYATANLGQGDIETESKIPAIDTTKYAKIEITTADKAIAQTFQKEPNAQMFFVMFPDKKDQAIVTGAYPNALRFDHQSNYHFHPGSGQLLSAHPYHSKSAGMQLVEMSYGIHTGQILSLPGKIIAFVASLIAAALPVTGFVIWYGRRNKKKPSVKNTKKASV